ncbi:MAG: peptidylprolyl isomerase, partial [Candidatus Thermoplasmatota archaeon]
MISFSYLAIYYSTPEAKKKENRVALIETNKGKIKILLYEDKMPITTKNFIELASSGFYNGLKFHRVEEWVIQTGDPKGDGTGGSNKTIPL